MGEPMKSDLMAVAARLDAMERWMERLSNTMEKLADNRERLSIVEVRVQGIDITVTDLKKTVETISVANQGQDVQIARLDMVKAAALFVAGVVISLISKKLGF